MEFLPACSPELNLDEQVWNHAKARLSKLFIASKEAMKRTLLSRLRSIQSAVLLYFFKRQLLIKSVYDDFSA